MKQIVTSFQNSFPFRIQGVHLFNVSTVAEYAFKIIKMVAKEKIVERASAIEINDSANTELISNY